MKALLTKLLRRVPEGYEMRILVLPKGVMGPATSIYNPATGLTADVTFIKDDLTPEHQVIDLLHEFDRRGW